MKNNFQIKTRVRYFNDFSTAKTVPNCIVRNRIARVDSDSATHQINTYTFWAVQEFKGIG